MPPQLFRHVDLFSRPPLASDPTPKPPTKEALDISQPRPRSPWPEPPKTLSMLVTCDVSGRVGVWAHGKLHLATIEPSPEGQPYADPVMQVMAALQADRACNGYQCRRA